jgi:hypothetical protein
MLATTSYATRKGLNRPFAGATAQYRIAGDRHQFPARLAEGGQRLLSADTRGEDPLTHPVAEGPPEEGGFAFI